MVNHESMDQPQERVTHKHRHKHRNRKNSAPSKFFVCLDYGFFAVFIGFLSFVLIKLVGL